MDAIRPDIFEIVFKLLSVHLGSASNGCQEDTENNYFHYVKSMIEEESSMDVKNIQHLKSSLLKRYQTMKNFLLSAVQQAELCRTLNINVCKRQANLSDNRLISQQQVADRRLRELVFEVIGEYGKSHIRLARRKAYMRDTGRDKLVLSIWSLRWSRFCVVLKKGMILSIGYSSSSSGENTASAASLNNAEKSLKFRLLIAQKDRDEINHTKKLLTKHLSAIPGSRLESFVCLSVIKISKTGSQTKATVATEVNSKEQKFFIAKSSTDLQAFETILHKWTYKHVVAYLCANNKQFPSSSSSKGGQPRPRSHQSSYPQDAFNIRSKEALKNILSAQCISWLHPPSYNPILWNDLQTLFRADDGSSTENDQQRSRDDFIRRYYLQFTSTLFNDNVYICLEERQLLLATGPAPYSAAPTETFDDGDNVLALLSALEDIYVEFGQTFATSVPYGKQLENIRKILFSTPLDYVAPLATHRSSSIERTKNPMVRAMLQTFPDVIQMRSTSCHTLLHFAPAMKMNLVETNYFAEYVSSCRAAVHSVLADLAATRGGDIATNSNANAEDTMAKLVVEPLSRSCPHPTIQHYSSTASHAMQSNELQRISMYCLSLVKPVPENSILRESADGRERDDPGKGPTQSPRYSQMVTIVPLSGECMRELFKAYILSDTPLFRREWVISSVYADSHSSENDIDSKLRRHFQEIASASAFDVLPDHSRYRGGFTCRKVSSSNDRIGSSQNRLKCMYALVFDENSFVESPSDDGVTSKQRAAKETEQHAYLVQFALSSERPSRHNSVSEGSSIDNVALERAIMKTPTRSSYHDTTAIGISEADAQRYSHIHTEDEQTFRAILLEEYDNSCGSGGDTVGHTAGGDGNGPKRIWDPTILSTVCRWRSCLCECAEGGGSGSNYLCTYHSELKAYLDDQHAKDGSSSESAKYLPRKAPMFAASGGGGGGGGADASSSATTAFAEDAKKDVITIRAASTLLQELWDGKLRSTVKSFTKKIVKDMSLRNHLQNSMPLLPADMPSQRAKLKVEDSSPSRASKTVPIPPVPSWSRWTDGNLVQRTVDGQNASLGILNSILNIECASTTELNGFAAMNMFPSAEMAAIRKEFKSFKEYQETVTKAFPSGENGNGSETSDSCTYDELASILDMERQICDRKLDQLTSKRREEEDRRAMLSKRAARAKAWEQLAMEQAKDPANFGNQRF